jgi:hypothetical protein
VSFQIIVKFNFLFKTWQILLYMKCSDSILIFWKWNVNGIWQEKNQNRNNIPPYSRYELHIRLQYWYTSNTVQFLFVLSLACMHGFSEYCYIRIATLCDKVCQWLVTGRWFSPGIPVSYTNEIDRHDVTKILLKVALNTINQINHHKIGFIHVIFVHFYLKAITYWKIHFSVNKKFFVLYVFIIVVVKLWLCCFVICTIFLLVIENNVQVYIIQYVKCAKLGCNKTDVRSY